MCTLSWWRGADGYSVFFNRDEQRTRAVGLPPAVHASGPVRFLAPRDPDGGGTWIAANEQGLTVLVLNRYDVPLAPPPEPVSRGTLVLRLAGESSAGAARRALDALDLRRFRPFTLALFEVGSDATLLGWDGTSLGVAGVSRPGLVATSSSWQQARAHEVRRSLFERALASGRADEAVLARVHADHADDQRALSPCMHREDACTVSFTRVRVGPGRVALSYQPGAPCEGARAVEQAFGS